MIATMTPFNDYLNDAHIYDYQHLYTGLMQLVTLYKKRKKNAYFGG